MEFDSVDYHKIVARNMKFGSRSVTEKMMISAGDI
jgi:hypothetical protein